MHHITAIKLWWYPTRKAIEVDCMGRRATIPMCRWIEVAESRGLNFPELVNVVLFYQSIV